MDLRNRLKREKTSRQRSGLLLGSLLLGGFLLCRRLLGGLLGGLLCSSFLRGHVHLLDELVVIAPQRRLYTRDDHVVHNALSFTRLSLKVFLNPFV
jgi:hypothetical protein